MIATLLQLGTLLLSFGILLVLFATHRIARRDYTELDRRQEFTELRLLAIEQTMIRHGMSLPPTLHPDDER